MPEVLGGRFTVIGAPTMTTLASLEQGTDDLYRGGFLNFFRTVPSLHPCDQLCNKSVRRMEGCPIRAPTLRQLVENLTLQGLSGVFSLICECMGKEGARHVETYLSEQGHSVRVDVRVATSHFAFSGSGFVLLDGYSIGAIAGVKPRGFGSACVFTVKPGTAWLVKEICERLFKDLHPESEYQKVTVSEANASLSRIHRGGTIVDVPQLHRVKTLLSPMPEHISITGNGYTCKRIAVFVGFSCEGFDRTHDYLQMMLWNIFLVYGGHSTGRAYSVNTLFQANKSPA
ncbi:hypothetical protein LSL4_gp117c [Pseudomonas phage LSL4]|nr:hypothetical protein LSL4_gp117c [Pseudomonas phage LSL4]